MIIEYDENFSGKFNEIWDFIALDSLNRANDFKIQLKKQIENIPHFPYKFRKSRWFDNENVRDLIFKGYTIPYLILDDKIVILDIFKWNK
jgi:hypothetical protein